MTRVIKSLQHDSSQFAVFHRVPHLAFWDFSHSPNFSRVMYSPAVQILYCKSSRHLKRDNSFSESNSATQSWGCPSLSHTNMRKRLDGAPSIFMDISHC